MKNNNKVSVLVVSYNAEKYIEKTIASCLGQSYGNLEVLLLDNASKDKTVEIAKRMQLEDDRLKVFESKENLGPYGGLNFLLEKADGEYIAIQDHDDIWFPKKIEKQVEFLDSNSDFFACGANTFFYFEDSGIFILNAKTEITDYVDHTSLMFRRDDSLSYDTDYLLADEHFEKKILGKKGKMYCIQEPLVIHRLKNDGTNLSTSRFKISLKNIKELFEINGYNLENFSYLCYLIISRFASGKLMWFFRRNITQKKKSWMTIEDFRKKYNEVRF